MRRDDLWAKGARKGEGQGGRGKGRGVVKPGARAHPLLLLALGLEVIFLPQVGAHGPFPARGAAVGAGGGERGQAARDDRPQRRQRPHGRGEATNGARLHGRSSQPGGQRGLEVRGGASARVCPYSLDCCRRSEARLLFSTFISRYFREAGSCHGADANRQTQSGDNAGRKRTEAGRKQEPELMIFFCFISVLIYLVAAVAPPTMVRMMSESPGLEMARAPTR